MGPISSFNSFFELFAGLNGAFFGFTELRNKFYYQEAYELRKNNIKFIKDKIEILNKCKTFLSNEQNISEVKKAKLIDLSARLPQFIDYLKETNLLRENRIQKLFDYRRFLSLFYFSFVYCIIFVTISGLCDYYPQLSTSYQKRLYILSFLYPPILFWILLRFHKYKIYVNFTLISMIYLLLSIILFSRLDIDTKGVGNFLEYIKNISLFEYCNNSILTDINNGGLIKLSILIAIFPLIACFFLPYVRDIYVNGISRLQCRLIKSKINKLI